MKIKTYKYKKVEVSETEIFIPQEPYYCFETGVRRSIRIIPIWTEWNVKQYQKPEEVYKLEITCVYQSFKCKVEKFSIPISEVETLVNREKDISNEKSILTLLLNDWGNLRTKEQFEEDLQTTIEELYNNK